MKKQQFVDVYQIMVTVESDKVQTTLLKYKTKFTGQNYLCVMMTKEDHDAGYNIGWGSSRLGQDEILKINRPLFGDKPTHLRRNIYFLEGQRDQAIALIKEDVEISLKFQAEESAKLLKAWETRKK